MKVGQLLQNASSLLLLLPLAAFIVVFLLVPCLMVLVNSFGSRAGGYGFQNYVLILTDEYYWEIILRTVRIAILATLISLALGYPAALYLYFSESAWRRVFLFLVVSPLFISAVVRTYGWVMIFTPNGALNFFLPVSLSTRLLKTETAIMIGLAHVYIPFMVLSLNARFVRIDKRLLVAAASLGAPAWRVFRDVLFPLSVPGIVSGCVIVFSVSMTAFSTPVLLGGTSNKTLAFMVYQKNILVSNPYEGGAFAVLLLVIAMGALWLFERLARGMTIRLGI